MAQILIRSLDSKVVARLKDQARQNGRSLQGEVKHLLEVNTIMYSDAVLRRRSELRERLSECGASVGRVLVRDLDPKVAESLRRQANASRRTVQAEALDILERYAKKMTIKEFLKWSEDFRRRLKGRKFPDSTELIREDRDR